jgi:hypothetical protein
MMSIEQLYKLRLSKRDWEEHVNIILKWECFRKYFCQLTVLKEDWYTMSVLIICWWYMKKMHNKKCETAVSEMNADVKRIKMH